MLLLRLSNRNRWDARSAEEPTDVAEAAHDVTLRAGEAGLSVFEVQDDAEADWVATLLALTDPGRLKKVDYLLIPPECFTALALTIAPVPDPRLIAELSDRHREVLGLDRAGGAEALAAVILR